MKIAIIGYGKLGKAIEACGEKHNFPLKITRTNATLLETEALKDVDVAIEISGPDGAVNHIKRCVDLQVPVVCGSTGWLDRWEEVAAYVTEKQGSLLYASNFSLGVNIFFALNQHLANWMDAYPQYDISLEETHHTEKKDAPSGTALTLARDILDRSGRKKDWAPFPASTDAILPIQSFREPDVPGTHVVRYTSPIDTIEIKHTAHSRAGFARGALLAAEWLPGKKGIFNMKDLLNL